MATEVWFRNCDLYIRELVEEGHTRLVFHMGVIVKKRIDPARFCDLYYGAGIDWRCILIDYEHAPEIRPGYTMEEPYAVYPVWRYGDDMAQLENLMANPVGDDPHICSDTSRPRSETPVLGQEHRVIISEIPPTGSGPGRAFVRQLKELVNEYPNCTVHPHGLYGFQVAFGMGWPAVDIEARSNTMKGSVTLPSGKEMRHEQTVRVPHWVTLLGMSPVDLQTPSGRITYNIRSALWAGEHFMENKRFRTGRAKDHKPVEIDIPSPTGSTPDSTHVLVHHASATVGDKFVCETCSLQHSCKYFRSGGVCSIPDSEPATLAKMFGTRNSDQILDGLGVLMSAQARRLERGLEIEEEYEELSPEVTKIIDSMFANGVKLAKLVNPALTGGPKVGVFVNAGGNGGVQVGAATPKALVAGVVAELEAKGVPRDQITPEMIQGLLAPAADPIEVLATEKEAS